MKKHFLILIAAAAAFVAWKIFQSKGATPTAQAEDINDSGGGDSVTTATATVGRFEAPVQRSINTAATTSFRSNELYVPLTERAPTRPTPLTSAPRTTRQRSI